MYCTCMECDLIHIFINKTPLCVSGHGIVINNPIEIVTYYINHRNAREKQILTALNDNTGKFLTTLDIVKFVYKVS